MGGHVGGQQSVQYMMLLSRPIKAVCLCAGVSREGKKHIRTSTASKGDLQLFIQLALSQTYDPTLPPDLAVPRALSHTLKEEVSKQQADKWLRRSNSGAPYFVTPELEDKLRAAQAVRSSTFLHLVIACACMPVYSWTAVLAAWEVLTCASLSNDPGKQGYKLFLCWP